MAGLLQLRKSEAIMNLEEEVVALKSRLERLEATVHRLLEGTASVAALGPDAPFDDTRLRAWLQAQGVISNPSPLEQAAAERWHALPEEEQRRLRAELERPSAGPMISDIVIEQRR